MVLVKLAKTLLSLRRSLGLIDFIMFGYFRLVLTSIRLPQFECRILGKILMVKMGL